MDDAPECIEHVWELRQVSFGLDGSIEDYACTRCNAVTVTRPASFGSATQA
jgi:hypothetical protein